MVRDSRVQIPEECRTFEDDPTSFDGRLQVAKTFIKKFVENIAPPRRIWIAIKNGRGRSALDRLRFVQLNAMLCRRIQLLHEVSIS